jgi:hypothetical protein
MTLPLKVEKARLDIVAAARFMLDGTLSFVEGARRISGARLDADLADLDEDIVPFVLIDSETDTLPFGEVRLLWAPEALARLQPDIDRAERWARDVGHVHCQKLIERFGAADRGAVLEEAEFWDRLARRINAALRASRDNCRRFLWLDGFVPDTRLPQLEQGTVLIWAFVSEDDGKAFAEYRLCLHLVESAVEKYRNGEWAGLLPGQDSAEWLAIDRASREIDVVCN